MIVAILLCSRWHVQGAGKGRNSTGLGARQQAGHEVSSLPLSARPAMAVPPAKGLDEACAWLRKAALTPFPPVTKSEQDYGHGRNKARTRAKLLF